MTAGGLHRRRRAPLLAALALTMALTVDVPGALADGQISAGPGSQFTTTSVTIDQGQGVIFHNGDLGTSHNVTSSADGPLFSSQTIGGGQDAPVDGTQYLRTGSYPFICSIHPFMHGTLIVTANGTPVARPPSSPPATHPARRHHRSRRRDCRHRRHGRCRPPRHHARHR